MLKDENYITESFCIWTYIPGAEVFILEKPDDLYNRVYRTVSIALKNLYVHLVHTGLSFAASEDLYGRIQFL